ncbi:isopentenyl diphosphate isomerase 1 [Actinidia rufa]|uniref:isopentenyl-diphosphate Delta-isomerase n=1 Tax=Actinidia rufa TaxID=165716 RepID=A0A7J0GUS2_9ERIC|nr:isopentenyl diphosphate isomerase 1 [Actinidia rufa]
MSLSLSYVTSSLVTRLSPRTSSLLPNPLTLRCSTTTRCSRRSFSHICNRRRLYSSAATTTVMGDAATDAAGMDAVQRRLMFEDECILVDENDCVVGHDTKYNCHLMEKIESENLLHRAFSVFLFNSKYELLLQSYPQWELPATKEWMRCGEEHLQRLASNNVLFSCLALVINYLIPTETTATLSECVRNAAQRKLLDELGIPAEDVPVDQFTPLGRILYKAPSDGKWGEHELDYLLFIVRDVNVHPNPDEVADIRYVDRHQLKELLRKADAGEEGLKLSPWFRLVVDNFLFKWWDHVEKGTLQEAADMKTIHKLT